TTASSWTARATSTTSSWPTFSATWPPSTRCGSWARTRRPGARPPAGGGRPGRRGGRRRTGSTTSAARSDPSSGTGSRHEDGPMIDVRRLRSEPEYRAGIERKRVAPGLIDEVLAADEARRAALGGGDGPPAPAGGLDHAELGERLGFVDTERAARMSGSRFAYLMGEAVLLEMALVRWVMGKLVDEGFTPVVPPVLVRESMMEAAGFFPTDRNQVYEVDGGELFLVGTSAVPLA